MANGRVYYVMVPEDAVLRCCAMQNSSKLGMTVTPIWGSKDKKVFRDSAQYLKLCCNTKDPKIPCAYKVCARIMTFQNISECAMRSTDINMNHI